jgi:uncharacterized protein (DUF2141 family)
MKRKISGCFSLFVLFLLVSAGASPAASESTGNLIVSISGFSSSDGFAMVALHNSEESYKGGGAAAFAKTQTRVVDQKVQVVFTNLPFGWYGVSLFHDENINGVLDMNVMGIPKEAYGFSNNAKGFFGKPAYNDVVFQLDSSEKEIDIKLD